MTNSKKSLALFLVLFVIFIDWLGIGLVYPIFSAMLFHPDHQLLAIGASYSWRCHCLGLLLAATPIAEFLSGPLLGAFSDQIGRRPLFLVTQFIAVIGYFLSALAVSWGSIAVLIGARALAGIAAGNAAVVGATVADLSTVETKVKNFGLYSMACGLGFTAGPLLSGALGSIFGFHVPFLLAALAILTNLILI